MAVWWGWSLVAESAAAEVPPREPWTSSRIFGTPEPPPPYRVEPAFPQLNFRRPVVVTNAPGTERLFVAEQDGRIYSFPNDSQAAQLDLVVDLKQVHAELTNVYGLTFDPGYTENRFVYVCYTLRNEVPDGTRVSRFEMSRSDPPQFDSASEQVVITWLSGGHNGGCLKFGGDGYLYISTGDGAGPSPPDTLLTGQDVSDLLASVLRIDVHRADGDQAYRVPSDNPLVGVQEARPEIWAYGFRNPWKMSFDRLTHELWVGDVGWELWEMVYRVQKGGNYGWSVMEGPQPVLGEQDRGPTPILPPTIYHPHSEAASITGGFVYRGSQLPELEGTYVYGDYQSGIIWGARMEADRVAWHEVLARTPLQLAGFGEDNHGELYLLDYRQQIYRLVENPEPDNSENFPRRLSETGLFADVASQEPAPGVIPYEINARHWADYAESQRWLAVPASGQIMRGRVRRDRNSRDRQARWEFPDGSVLAKTISIEMVRGDASSRRRLETQILHREADSWRPYTYVWNEEQTDADLASAEGFSRPLEVRDDEAPGGVREQTYRFASRQECLLCHNPWVEARTTIFGFQSASLLGVSLAQLDRPHSYGGESVNQLRTFAEMGVLDPRLLADAESTQPFADPYDPAADLNARARAYLHVNCSHCHQFGAGGSATIWLAHSMPLDEAQVLDVRPTQGTFGIAEARIITPGDPLSSVLFYRVAKLGAGRMPRAGSSEIDPRGVRMLYDWISQLSPGAATADRLSELDAVIDAALQVVRRSTSAEARAGAIAELASSARGALALRCLLDQTALGDDARSQVVALTSRHEATEVRDLFEGFVPASERVQRLGTVVNQAEILSLEADVDRGREVFLNNSAAACKNCHRVGQDGENLGPDLSEIGKKYRRDQLLQHILEPSRFMEPQYVPYLIETTDGHIFTGLLDSQSETEIVLKDAKNQAHRFVPSEVELLVRQQQSLMPDLLLRDMTRQQVADLLAFLQSLR